MGPDGEWGWSFKSDTSLEVIWGTFPVTVTLEAVWGRKTSRSLLQTRVRVFRVSRSMSSVVISRSSIGIRSRAALGWRFVMIQMRRDNCSGCALDLELCWMLVIGEGYCEVQCSWMKDVKSKLVWMGSARRRSDEDEEIKEGWAKREDYWIRIKRKRW